MFIKQKAYSNLLIFVNIKTHNYILYYNLLIKDKNTMSIFSSLFFSIAYYSILEQSVYNINEVFYLFFFKLSLYIKYVQKIV